MRLIGKFLYHLFNIVFRVALVCAGLIILVVGINILAANFAAAANEFNLRDDTTPIHIELPSFVPEKIKGPVDQFQARIETWGANLIKLDEATMFLNGDREDSGSTSQEPAPAETPNPTEVSRE